MALRYIFVSKKISIEMNKLLFSLDISGLCNFMTNVFCKTASFNFTKI